MAATSFCTGPEIKSLPCGWAGDVESSRTAGGAFAGTLWTAELNPPQLLAGNRSYYQVGRQHQLEKSCAAHPLILNLHHAVAHTPSRLSQRRCVEHLLLLCACVCHTNKHQQVAPKIVSLACPPGRLSVRTVFKYLPGSKGCSRLLLDSDTLGSFGRAATPITRCQLRFSAEEAAAANGTDAAAIQAALTAPDTACEVCRTCSTCSQDVGVWYSDSGSFAFGGCPGVAARPNVAYVPTTPGVIINPGNSILLAAISVGPAKD